MWHSDKAVLLAVLPAVQAQIARAPVFFGAVRARCFLFVVPCEGREGGSGQIAYSGLGVCVWVGCLGVFGFCGVLGET